jgi:abortive infection bacteriophage resistance protein
MNAESGPDHVGSGIDDLLDRLRKDGLFLSPDEHDVHSIHKARYYITRVGEYRFVEYFRSLKAALPAGTTIGLNDVLCLNKFDRRLRLLSLDALERIEVGARSFLHLHLTQLTADRLRSLRRAVPANVNWLHHVHLTLPKPLADKIEHGVEQHSDFKWKFGDLKRVPSGFAMESLTLNDIQTIYKCLPIQAQQDIARRFEASPDKFGLWLNFLRKVRNIAAHHSPLWNYSFHNAPGLPKPIQKSFGDVMPLRHAHLRYYNQAIIMFFLLRCVARNTAWHQRLLSLLYKEPLVRQRPEVYVQMGFPNEWYRKPFWSFDSASISKIGGD